MLSIPNVFLSLLSCGDVHKPLSYTAGGYETAGLTSQRFGPDQEIATLEYRSFPSLKNRFQRWLVTNFEILSMKDRIDAGATGAIYISRSDVL